MFRTIILMTISTAFLACSGSDDEESASETEDDAGMEPMVTEASAMTQDLWGEIEGYTSWENFPEQTEIVRSTPHNGMYVLTYYNDVVAAAMESDEPLPLPDGSIIVKENYMSPDDAAPMALTVMSKMDSEWYWVQGSLDGQMVFVGPDGPLEGKDVGMCVSCHSASSANDYVMVHQF